MNDQRTLTRVDNLPRLAHKDLAQF